MSSWRDRNERDAEPHTIEIDLPSRKKEEDANIDSRGCFTTLISLFLLLFSISVGLISLMNVIQNDSKDNKHHNIEIDLQNQSSSFKTCYIAKKIC
jgi:hypothetical protein